MRKIFALIGVTWILSACNTGMSNQKSNNIMGMHIDDKQSLKLGNELPLEDILTKLTNSESCKYDSTHPQVVISDDKSVVVTVPGCLTAQFAIGSNSIKQWVMRDYLLINELAIQVNFTKDVSTNLHLSSLYNDLQHHGLVGHVAQLETGDCDSLIKSGSTKGKSCKIQLTYRGDSMTGDQNIIHFVFSNGDTNILDVPLVATNSYFTNQNIPIMNTSGLDSKYYFNSTSENSGHSGLEYSNSFSFGITNLGSEVLFPNDYVPQDIKISLGTKFGMTATNLYFSNSKQTSCSGNKVPIGSQCKVSFYDKKMLLDDNMTSLAGRFNFVYMSNENSEVNNTEQFYLGVGDLSSQDYILRKAKSKFVADVTLDINKIHYGDKDSALIYGIPLKNIKFSIKYTPQLFIANYLNVQQDRLNYSFGDFSGGDLSSQIQGVTISYDNDCFSDGFNFTQESTPSTGSVSCKLNFHLPDKLIEMVDQGIPLGFQLTAEYDSPTMSRHIKQFIGNITVATTSSGDDKTPDSMDSRGYSFDHKLEMTLGQFVQNEASVPTLLIAETDGLKLYRCDVQTPFSRPCKTSSQPMWEHKFNFAIQGNKFVFDPKADVVSNRDNNELTFQDDTGKILERIYRWHSDIAVQDEGLRLFIQSDGNFVLYDYSTSRPLWATGTNNK